MNNIQVSGVGIVGEIPWGTHFCQFYETNKERMDVAIPYFKAGLENNELCISVTLNPLEAKEVLRWAFPDFDINPEVWDITESKREEDEIRQRVEKLRVVSEELALFNCAVMGWKVWMIKLKEAVK